MANCACCNTELTGDDSMIWWTDDVWICPECYVKEITNNYSGTDIAEKFGDKIRSASFVDNEDEKAKMRRAGIIDGFI